MNEQQIRYEIGTDSFYKIPGSPIAYWISHNLLNCFENKEPLDNYYKFREGIHTADNNRFLRFWYEIENNKMVFHAHSYVDVDERGKWIPYNKGGDFRKWYGNNEYVIAFDAHSRFEMNKLQGHVRPSQELYFIEGATWTAVSSGNFGMRYYPEGFLFDAGGQVAVGKNIEFCLTYLNSVLFQEIAKLTMPTINYKCGIIKTLPNLCIYTNEIKIICKNNIQLSKNDWDSFETSWDFKKHPLI